MVAPGSSTHKTKRNLSKTQTRPESTTQSYPEYAGSAQEAYLEYAGCALFVSSKIVFRNLWGHDHTVLGRSAQPEEDLVVTARGLHARLNARSTIVYEFILILRTLLSFGLYTSAKEINSPIVLNECPGVPTELEIGCSRFQDYFK